MNVFIGYLCKQLLINRILGFIDIAYVEAVANISARGSLLFLRPDFILKI